MKKVVKKVYAIILIILMLTNYMSVIVNAVGVERKLVLELVSDVHKYNKDEEIIVELKVSDLTDLGKVKVYNGIITIEGTGLELLEIIGPEGHTNTSDKDGKSITISNSPNDGVLGVGDTICTLKFKALEPSTTPTTIKIIESDVTCNSGSAYYEDGNVNDPEITFPVESVVIPHNLKITKTDESKNAITNNRAVFEITKLDGTTKLQETDENGSLVLSNLEKPTTEAPYIYTVEEIAEPTGFVKLEKPVQVTVTFDELGNIQTALSNENGIASVITETNTIELKVLNAAKEPEVKKEVFNLVINKVDEENNSITTDVAEFTVTMPDGSKANYETGSNGRTGNIAVLAPEAEGTYTYIIKETKAPEGYVAEENNIILELTYEKQANKIVLASGKVVSYNDEAITIEAGDPRTATVNIKNEKQVTTYNYTINVNKTDVENNNITSSNAVFEITKDGKSEYIVTNSEGKATYNFSKTNKEIVPNQEYVYTLKEIKAPDGYILDETTKTVKLTFNSDGTIKTSSLNETTVEHTTNEVNIKVVNEKEPEIIPPIPQDFDLVVNKVDEEGQPITAETKYMVTLPNGTQVEYSTTGSDKSLPAPEKAGTYVYVLTETTTPAGYIKGEDIVLKLTFEEVDGKIVLVSGDNGVNVTEEENVKVATINVTTQKEIITYNYMININKVKNDTFKNNITEDTAVFEITKDEEISYIKTNALGKAIYQFSMTNKEITEGQEYIYKVKEIKAPNGYILDETVKTITVTFNNDGSINTATVDGNKIEKINHRTDEVNVKIINEQEEQEIVPPTPQDFKLLINKVDEAGEPITTETKYMVTLPNGEQKEYSTTGEDKMLPAPEKAGTYVYVLSETTTPAGYIKGEDIVLKLTFEEIDGKIVLVSGDNGVNVTEEENVKVATLNVITKEEIITHNYTLNIDKVKNDTSKTNITEDSAMFEITANGQTSYIKTNEQGKATYEFKLTNKEIVEGQEYVYALKEIKAPNGYILDETTKTITITFNTNGTINTAVVSGTKIEMTNNSENTVNIKVINEKEPEVVEPVPQNFDLIINKVDGNRSLITTDTANFVLTNTNGESTTISTVNGVSSRITLNAPNVAGKQIYFLQETKAPQGYDILNESIVIEANFIESEGKIILSSAKVKEYNEEITPSNNTLTISVINTKHEVEEPENYTIKISGVDRENNPIENGTTVIKLTNKHAGTYEYKEVSIKDGIIELELPKVAGNVSYELEQIKAPDGYEVNKEPAQITITFAKGENEKIEVTNYTVTGEDVAKGTSTVKNTVSLVITNDKIQEEPQKQNYSIEINKLDSNTKEAITQGSAVFTVVDPKGNTKEYGTTDGKILISNIIPGNIGESHTYIIKEKTAPTGYKLPNETVVMKVSFEEVEGRIVITEPELIIGSSIATCDKTQNGNIKIDITNEKEDEDLYVISKKDTAGIDIYNLFNSYTGRHYTVDEPFIDTKEAKRGNTVSVQTFINNLESNGILTVWDEEGNQIPNNNRIKTGMILKATKGEQNKTFKIVAKGDADGDGRVRTLDLDMLIKHLSKEQIIQNPLALRALDLREESGDGIIRTTDLDEYYKVLSK